MASDALRNQVASKWQEAFTRLNRGQPGISGLMTFSEAWKIATEFLRPGTLKGVVKNMVSLHEDMSEVRAAFGVVNQCRRLPLLLETSLGVRAHYPIIQREIKSNMEKFQETSDPQFIREILFRLVKWYNAWSPPPEFGSTIFSAYVLTFQTNLFSSLPPSFSGAFKTLCASTLPLPDAEDDPDAQTMHQSTWTAIESLGLVDQYESIIASVGYEYIEAHVFETCTGKWSEPMLEGLRTWMSDKVVPWMLLTYARGASSTEEARTMLQGVGSRFDFHMNKTLCDLRTKEIFDIIIDFPDSMGALQDLKDCLQRVDQRASLVQALRKANRKRLLHPGADTKLILSQYVATIKCLRIIDPPGVCSRPDTIRSIVANLVGDDDSGDSLVDENEPIQPLQQPEAEIIPVDAGPDPVYRFSGNKPSDVISTLVSIYDSKDLFVKELQALLAQRLLAIDDDNFEKVEKEVKAALQVCEVMLKDMTDSKRIDGHVQSQKASIIHPTIISRHFWPALESSDIIMPGQFQKLQEQYAEEFTIFKPDKRLRWLPHLGTVHLELQLEDRVVEADVPPLEAAFIELFSQKALFTWVDLGVLKEEDENTFRLLEVAEEQTPRENFKRAPAPPDIPPVTSMQQQQAEKTRVYWKFIEGMLTNLGTLPLDRIQTMLKFVPGYDQSIEQLGDFMEAARREGLVVGRDGTWRLNR
ncbi:hypothetical protein BD779DRAFT_1528109 [Infundibulicybe gibba]|nr:hypothetical protein BD779DRAFT_1528109 [Infundibulicybe gibba]